MCGSTRWWEQSYWASDRFVELLREFRPFRLWNSSKILQRGTWRWHSSSLQCSSDIPSEVTLHRFNVGLDIVFHHWWVDLLPPRILCWKIIAAIPRLLTSACRQIRGLGWIGWVLTAESASLMFSKSLYTSVVQIYFFLGRERPAGKTNPGA